MMISPQEAWERIAGRLQPLGTESVERRAASGRVLAEALTATVDLPAFDVSAMDGYALQGGARAGDRLPVAGVVAAGDPPGGRLRAGAAMRIMTGAPMPVGADTVIPVELTDGGAERVEFTSACQQGANVRLHGEVLRRGSPLLEAGAPITPGALALLATHGYRQIPVRRRPRVAVLPTGDEVVPPEQQPAPGQLRDSHTDFLLAACGGLGMPAESLGIAPDRIDELRRLIRAGMERDVLLVCGGVSMGEFDFVENVLTELGCELLFDAVAVQPGKPLVAAHHPGGWVLGLPGNPASVMVCFWLFARPLLRVLAGASDRYWQGAMRGVLDGPLPGARGRDRFLPAEVSFAGGVARVRPVPPRGSHDLSAYARGAYLVRVPANASPGAPGDPCQVLPLTCP